LSCVTEGQLVAPALVLLSQAEGATMTTTDLLNELRRLLNPSGDDLLTLEGRNDDRFSQKVRNLKSHDTLAKSGFAEHTNKGFRLTEAGRAEARRRAASVEALAGFPLDAPIAPLHDMDSGAEIVVLDENIVTEGQLQKRNASYRSRSKKLRTAAFEHYACDGVIPCTACSFSFDLAYGKRGSGYIQIHHLEPLSFGGERELTLEEAITKVRPLCANCHVMVHRSDPWLSMESLIDALRVTYNYSQQGDAASSCGTRESH